MPFDPDAYLKEYGSKTTSSGSFDPDQYLATYGQKSNDVEVSPVLRKIAQVLYTPARLGRAVGVGVQEATKQVFPYPKVGNIDQAVQSAKEAYQPGFQPKPGQKMGSVIGEMAGIAPVMAAGALVPGGLPAEIATGAALGGGMTAIQQASEQGKVKVLPTIPKSFIDLVPDSVIGNAIFGGVLPATSEGIEAFKNGVKSAALKILPRTFEKTASLPGIATQEAIKNPSLTNSIPEVESKIQDMATKTMQALRDAKDTVGQAHASVYSKYAQMQGPMQEILEGSPTKLRPFEDIRKDWLKAKNGTLFDDNATNIEKLQTLTKLKREASQYSNFYKTPFPNTVEPIDSASSAAAKKISSDVNDLRSSLPNGKKLEMADNGWKSLNDIYSGLQKDLADPGKSQDTLYKIYKGDLSGITQGRTAEKMARIKKLENLSGQKIWQPVSDLFTSREFNKYMGKGISNSLLDAGSLIGMGAGGYASLQHPVVGTLAALVSMATGALGSPKAIGLGLKTAAGVGSAMTGTGRFIANPGIRSALLAALLSENQQQRNP